jgi:hypothetical protein
MTTNWFARPILNVTNVEATLRFFTDQLGFTSPWRYEENGRLHIAQVDAKAAPSSWPTPGPTKPASR